ncbi:MAG: hypothetical protein LBN93_10595 [Candidatus Symbiothrix sp.]|jgi:hypothetical protein|nr:hypothetical protein [Candidatus Symbiothrix sp.]
MAVKALEKQSVLDIAVQTAGSVEAAFLLAFENGLSMTDDLSAGDEMTSTNIVSRDIADYYKNKRLTPATALTENLGEGVEFWYVEYDFIVS